MFMVFMELWLARGVGAVYALPHLMSLVCKGLPQRLCGVIVGRRGGVVMECCSPSFDVCESTG